MRLEDLEELADKAEAEADAAEARLADLIAQQADDEPGHG